MRIAVESSKEATIALNRYEQMDKKVERAYIFCRGWDTIGLHKGVRSLTQMRANTTLTEFMNVQNFQKV